MVIYLMLTTIHVAVVEVNHFDKLVHWLAFTLLMSWYAQLMNGRQHQWRALVLMLVLGIGLEYLQGLNPNRQFDYVDMVANVMGIITGVLLMRFSRMHYLRWIDGLVGRLQRGQGPRT